jgi:hypothetical protein
MTRIVTGTDRYKRPARKERAVPLTDQATPRRRRTDLS